MERTLWQRRLQNTIKQNLRSRVFAGFNTNVDVVVHLDNSKVGSLLADNAGVDLEVAMSRSIDDVESISERVDLITVLADRLKKGKSFHIVVESRDVLQWLDRHLSETAEESMGGQAGIIANQMAKLGADAIVYTSLLSPKQAEMFDERVKTPVCAGGRFALVPVHSAARPADSLKINWILEYGKNITFEFGTEKIVTPRANRVILATRPRDAIMGFGEEMHDYLPELGSRIDVGFLAGYHYADKMNPDGRSFDQYMNDTTRDLKALKKRNPDLCLHYEYVPMKVQELEKEVLSRIFDEVKSFGINENEIRRVLGEFGFNDRLAAIEEEECAYTLYLGALELLKHLNLERIQVHNLGYYVLVLANPYPRDLEQVREASLYATAVNAIKAKYSGYVTSDKLDEAKEIPLSNAGFEQLEDFERKIKARGDSTSRRSTSFSAEGIMTFADHSVLVIPAHIVPDPVSTVGMGDTISSSSYAAECGSLNEVQKHT